jgi:3-dehydroquinate synthetase
MATFPITEHGRVVSEVMVGPGLASTTGSHDLLPADAPAPGRVAVFAHAGSESIARDLAGRLDAAIRVLPDREEAKRIDVVERSYLWLNDLGLTRTDLVVGVGGGALTDVVGFIASTYLRGLPVALVPTTLLAAVDAAIGGKTAVNVGGKNLAGTFRHPGRVLVDTDILARLPQPLLREGGAEAVKAGWLADPELVDLYERRGIEAPVDEVVARAVAVKAGIVSADFREHDRRAWLNYGHTIGHAVEMVGGMSHGSAVSVGMVAAAAVSRVRHGFRWAERQRMILEGMGLPVAAPGLDPTAVRALIALDKKRDADGLRMTLLRDIADPVVEHVGSAEIDEALDAVGIG